MSGLVNTAPARATELQHEAIQHSNVLSPGSHFNHSLFSATVPAGCKLCGAVINPCQVRKEEEEEEGEGKKTQGNELKHEVPLIIAPHRSTPQRSMHARAPALYCFAFVK